MDALVTFKTELQARRDALAATLPRHISFEKFAAAMESAVRNNPDILKADRLSVMVAVTQAAEDGMMPDGRSGVITVYNEKRKDGNREFYVKVAKWTPMLQGIVDRAAECGILIDAQVIHENDVAKIMLGTSPSVVHEVDPKKPRGKYCSVYAHFKRAVDGATLHVEFMDGEKVAKVKSCAKAQNGLLWTKFEDQAWCKVAIRRGSKRVRTLPREVTRMIERDDDQYSFDPHAETLGSAGLVSVPRAPQIEHAPQAAMPSMASISAMAQRAREPVTADAPPPPHDEPPQEPPQDKPKNPEADWLDKLETLFATITDMKALDAAWKQREDVIENRLSHEAKQRAYAIWNTHEARLTSAQTEAAE